MEIKQILTRFYVHNMDEAISFYEKLLNTKCTSRFKYPEASLELAVIQNILIIAGSDEALKPFIATYATFLVDSITDYKDFLLKSGAQILRDIQIVPTGFNMTAKHPDGTIIEYVEHKHKV